MTTEHHSPPRAAILLVPLAVALALALFAWPSARLEPRDLPIGVAGAPAAADAIETKLAARAGAFDLHRYGDEASARRAIEDRDVYGAFVATPTGLKLLTASAASPVVAQVLENAARESGAREGGAVVPVEDVVPASAGTGALGASVLPLVLAGILTGIVAVALASRGWSRAGLVVAASVLTGLAATVIVQSWLEVVEGAWLANAAVLSLTVLAIASVVAGLNALLDLRGLILAAVTMVFIGNPFSGVGSAPEMLPRPAGDIGQLMPPGAGGNLLRSTGFFDGAAAGGHIAVLAAWTIAGLAALIAANAIEASRARSTSKPEVQVRLSATG